MYLKSLFLQNFRNYTKSEFTFNKNMNAIVAPNGAGKTNLLEAIFLLSTGRSFKAEKYDQMIKFGEQFSRVQALIGSKANDSEDIELQVVVGNTQGFTQKKFSVNGVAKHRVGFSGKLTVALFLPTDLDIVIGNPSVRRRFLDDVLEQTDSKYSNALAIYTKALRQRNALLGQAQESGRRDAKAFSYWDNLLIANGQVIASKREELLSFINQRQKTLFGFELVYDKSEISTERLAQYNAAEMGAGVTLVGPHRDEVLIKREGKADGLLGEGQQIKHFASRGQQRLIVLELKLAQIAYMEKRTGERPMLLLDDIFSELDKTYIGHILEILPEYQTVITTTHKEFVEGLPLRQGNVIELRKES